MNADIQFQISAPASLSIFGEHAKNRLRASIDLRTTMIFQAPASLPNDIEINFPGINLVHNISLQKFLNFYNYCVENTELLHERVLQFTFQYESMYQKIFLQIFYYLLVRITYEEQIEIKTFSLLLTTQLISNGEFISLASLKVCLAACLLNWSRLQKGAYSTFDKPDLKRIWVYAKFCEKIAPESDLIDLMVCTYGSLMKYEREQNMYKRLCLPSILFTKTILIVDSNQTQDVKVQKQQIAKFMNTFPELANSVLNNIDIVTNIANDVFQEIFDVYKDNELSIKIKNDYLLQQDKALETCIRMNQKLLRMLDVSYIHLDEICAIAQKHRLSGKYTDLGNGRYVYIWCPSYLNVTDITSFINELNICGFDVISTNLLCTGVKIEYLNMPDKNYKYNMIKYK